MKRLSMILCAVVVQVGLFAQQYFPEGTKWTEIRLDTVKYDSWYSKVGDEWVANFETVEYQVKGKFIDESDDYSRAFKRVYTNSSTWADSLTLLIYEEQEETHDWEVQNWITATVPLFYESHCAFMPGLAYDFNWKKERELYSITIEGANCTCLNPSGYKFGTIEDIKEGYFGGVRQLKYVDLSGMRIIQGIGVTAWNGGECLFGPVEPYNYFRRDDDNKERHYRSMLVHFERNGEVLYDVWPQKDADGIEGVYVSEKIAHGSTYDLSGRTVVAPRLGLYIKDGKKVGIR